MTTLAPPPIAPFLWLMVIFLSLTFYVTLDGYDLGIGVLLLFERDNHRRRTMLEIIATAWDGNESWLVLVAIGLFGGFPLAYSTLLPALYVPFVLMLLSLIFRGVSIEFRKQAPKFERGWIFATSLGSLLAAFCQGMIFGSLVVGIPTKDGHFFGKPFGFLQGFSLLTGVLCVCTYCLIGASWLNNKTEGALAANAKRKGRILAIVVAILCIVTIVLTPLISPVFSRMFNMPLLFVVGATLLALVSLWITWYSLKRLNNITPFLFAVFPLVLAIASLLAINYPYLIPPNITFWEAASPRSTVDFLLIGVGFCIPVVLGYNAFAHVVFRGKFPFSGQRKV